MVGKIGQEGTGRWGRGEGVGWIRGGGDEDWAKGHRKVGGVEDWGKRAQEGGGVVVVVEMLGQEGTGWWGRVEGGGVVVVEKIGQEGTGWWRRGGKEGTGWWERGCGGGKGMRLDGDLGCVSVTYLFWGCHSRWRRMAWMDLHSCAAAQS